MNAGKCYCGQAAQRGLHCSSCGATLCEACANQRDKAGRGPRCCTQSPPAPPPEIDAQLIAGLGRNPRIRK